MTSKFDESNSMDSPFNYAELKIMIVLHSNF